MGNELKGALYRALKHEGAEFDTSYAKLTVAELEESYTAYVAAGRVPADVNDHPLNVAKAAAPAPVQQAQPPQLALSQPSIPVRRRNEPAAPMARKDPKEMAGQRTNSKAEDEPIRVDPNTGFTWYQEEVLKPAFAKPRGRRVLDYVETGVKVSQSEEGDYRETFEVAGDMAPTTAQVKITLPSYQVGIYKDPRFPFKVITYNENVGFDLKDVEMYYGGSELVPDDVKRKYVENVLCYDQRSVIRAIQREARELTLSGHMR